jgi:hypothetical protein
MGGIAPSARKLISWLTDQVLLRGLRIMELITYILAPHPQPLSQREKGARKIRFPFSPWEKGLGDEGVQGI